MPRRTRIVSPGCAAKKAVGMSGKRPEGTSRVAAHPHGDAKVAATALELGVVSSIVRSGQSVSLNVGTLGAFKLDDIRQII